MQPALLPPYLGVQKRPEIANNEHLTQIDFRINPKVFSFFYGFPIDFSLNP